jgi:adenylate cyclase
MLRMSPADLHPSYSGVPAEVTADHVLRAALADIAALAFENGRHAERARHDAIARDNFRRYLSPAQAVRILTDPHAAALGGETRPAAVLFGDLRGFTALTETMGPSATARVLSEMFGELVECIVQCGGMVDKFIGDAVMAQWGAPEGTGDEADRAVEAAVQMLTCLEGLNARWAVEAGPSLHMGIGLDYGEVFAGNIGSEQRLEYTLIGDVVNTASRLCAVAGPGEILVSDALRRALRGPWSLCELPPVVVKGKRSPVAVHRMER